MLSAAEGALEEADGAGEAGLAPDAVGRAALLAGWRVDGLGGDGSVEDCVKHGVHMSTVTREVGMVETLVVAVAAERHFGGIVDVSVCVDRFV